MLLDVDVDASPFALAARATANAMLGDHKAAIADVHAVEALAEEPDSNVSYWDLWIARIAGVASAAGAEAQARVEQMRADVETVGDVVVRAYARDVLGRVCGGGETPSRAARMGRRGGGDRAALTGSLPACPAGEALDRMSRHEPLRSSTVNATRVVRSAARTAVAAPPGARRPWPQHPWR